VENMPSFFGKGKVTIRGKKWDWGSFQSTKGFPVSDELLDWVVGQDGALKECYLCLDEWVHKLEWMQKEDWYKAWKDPKAEKPSAKKSIPAGPYLLLLGDPGTGKSLIGRALASHLTELYKTHNIKLRDVICWKNEMIPSEPRISIVKAGEAKKIVRKERKKAVKKRRWFKWGFRLLQGLMMGFGVTVLAIVFGLIISTWLSNPLMYYWSDLTSEWMTTGLQERFNYNFLQYLVYQFMGYAQMLYLGIGAISMGAMIFIFKNILGRGNLTKGIGGAESTEAPKLIVDNAEKVAPFIDATGHKSPQLFGSIAWDPYQTGGLGTPEHQRTTAGDVHKANLGILYIDEIKNLHPEEAVTLLTVLEEGQLPITLRSRWSSGGTSAMAVSTEPVPCLSFVVGAGNFDSINKIHPALMDRIYGYGKVVRMNNDMPNTLKNRRKYVQFIAQEVKRFRFPPFSREACEEIITEGRRKCGKRDRLSTKFRPLISIIKTAATLSMNEKRKDKEEILKEISSAVEFYRDRGININPEEALEACSDLMVVERKHVIEAINEHCKTVQKQILEHRIKEKGKLLEIDSKGKKMGTIYGLAVVADPFSGEHTGSILRVKASMMKKGKGKQGYFKVSGVAKHGKFIEDSIDKVRSVILKKYKVDVAQDYCTHIDFSQAYGIDGPSAGVTMAILLCSLLEGKMIRQDIAVTGEINISTTDQIGITAVGGIYEKIKAAERWGFKKVIVPQKNFKHSIDVRDYSLEVLSGKMLDDYLQEILVGDGMDKDGKKKKTQA